MPDTPIYIPDGVLANPLDADDVIRVDRSGKTMYTRVEEFASDPAFTGRFAPLSTNSAVAWDSFTTLGDITNGRALPSGQEWNQYLTGGENMTVAEAGSLTKPTAESGYLWVNSFPVQYVGLEFSFSDGSTTDAAVAFGSSKGAGPSGIGAEGVATNSLHMVVTPEGWNLAIVNFFDPVDSLNTFALGTFDSPLATGTKYRCALYRVSQSRIDVLLPDGTTVTTTEANPGDFDAYWGPTQWWQLFQPPTNFATDRRPTIHGIYSGPAYKPADTGLQRMFGNLSTRRWTTRTSAADNDWSAVCWSPELGLFAAVGSSGTGNRVMTSPDGITWTTQTSAANNSWLGVCWSPELSLFAAVAATGTNNRVMTSPDGTTWTAQTSAADNTWQSVCWSPQVGLFVAVSANGTNNRVMTSPDGITWTTRTTSGDAGWVSVCWSPELGLFVAVADAGSDDSVMTSPDGITWTARTPSLIGSWRSVAWSPALGLFAAVRRTGTGNRVMTSPDGITWTGRVSAADNVWRNVTWSPALGLFVAVSNSGTGNRVMASSDGITWTSRTSAADNNWNSVCWSPELGMFAAVAATGTGDRVMTSRLLAEA